MSVENWADLTVVGLAAQSADLSAVDSAGGKVDTMVASSAALMAATTVDQRAGLSAVNLAATTVDLSAVCSAEMMAVS